MSERIDAAQPPDTTDLVKLERAAAECRSCPLWAHATQTVFGDGGRQAAIMLVGEQPGDQEDTAGKPFVGPAGKVLARAMDLAGMSRGDVFVTNAVKHFKWEAKGGRRLHKKPTYREVSACYPWLEAEIQAVRPQVIVCLGATASQSLMGRDFKLSEHVGRRVSDSSGRTLVISVHPSYYLRQRDHDAREGVLGQLVEALELARTIAASPIEGRAYPA